MYGRRAPVEGYWRGEFSQSTTTVETLAYGTFIAAI